MTKITTVLLLSLALAGAAAAKDEAAKGSVKKKDAAQVTPQGQSGTNATKAESYSAKGNVSPSSGKESVKDPYAVPLLREARPL